MLLPVQTLGKTDCRLDGQIYGQAQNLARTLMEMPANRMTPTIFTDRAKEAFAGLENVDVLVHDLGE